MIRYAATLCTGCAPPEFFEQLVLLDLRHAMGYGT